MEMSDQLHDPDALLPGKGPWYPLDRNRSEKKAEKKGKKYEKAKE
jgi:hypothetical protein